MLGKMIIKGAVLVAGVLVTDAVMERMDKAALKRKRHALNKNHKKEEEVELTEEDIKRAFEQAHKMADELEGGIVK